MTRLEELVAAMRAELTAQCRLVKAATMVLDESPPCPERDAVAAEIQAEAQSVIEACRHFNNLRSLVGTLERAIGNRNPQFYEGDLRASGLPIEGCHCGQPMCSMARDVTHVPTRQGTLDAHDYEGAKPGGGNREQQAVDNVSDDLHCTPIVAPQPQMSRAQE